MPSVNNVITFEITVITKNYAYALHAGCRLEVKKLVNLEFVDHELWWCCRVTFNAGRPAVVWKIVWKGHPMLAVGTGVCCLDIFSLVCLSLSLGDGKI